MQPLSFWGAVLKGFLRPAIRRASPWQHASRRFAGGAHGRGEVGRINSGENGCHDLAFCKPLGASQVPGGRHIFERSFRYELETKSSRCVARCRRGGMRCWRGRAPIPGSARHRRQGHCAWRARVRHCALCARVQHCALCARVQHCALCARVAALCVMRTGPALCVMRMRTGPSIVRGAGQISCAA
jgi:hypothetical protein